MGSGLILLVIVGAWLAVLVPMALRSQDATNALGSVDKFHDAMRVLSRRDARAAAREAGDDLPPEPPGGGEPMPVPPRRTSAASPEAARARAAAASRRVKVLLSLVALSLLTLLGAVLGPLWLLAPHLLVDLLLAGMVVHLRRLALARAERERRAVRTASRRRLAERVAPPAVRHPVHVVGVPDRMPPRLLPLGASVPAARTPEPAALAPARGAQGEAWSPVPVPTPTYLTAPTAPRRVVDLTRPGAYADAVAAAERETAAADVGPQPDEILDRQRAVNDW